MILATNELPTFSGKVVMVDGGFDPLHAGHLAYFEAASKLGLPVLCNTRGDEYIQCRKQRANLLPEEQRARLLDSLSVIDYVHVCNTSTEEVLATLRPRAYVKGADWDGKLPQGEVDLCQRLGIDIVFLDTVIDSSTDIVGGFLERHHKIVVPFFVERFEELVSQQRPIPGDWYDADYFEHGRKSNWQEGYGWPAFAGLFRDAAEFLTSMFPEADSFLDAGCAKGFLVRTLRERGKDASGIDHSAWAIEHAEELARPYLRLGSVDEAEFSRDHDVTLAFSLLESLTETQAVAFLRRVRRHTRQALFAIITTAQEGGGESHPNDNRDLSHITLRDRAWWDERLRSAGWQKDALHRIVERQCQRHPLPVRMGWSVFVAAPGDRAAE